MENTQLPRRKLQEEYDRLTLEIEEISKPQDFGDDVDGLDEETDESESAANRLAIVQTLKDRVNEIAAALQRIENGTYAICTECGKSISSDILETVPESALCANCKQKQS